MKRLVYGRSLPVLALCWGLAIARGTAQTPQTALPQEMRSAWSGVYSEAQAKRGAGVYAASCARCHAKDLEGIDGYGRPLAGDDFLKSLNNVPVSFLYDRTLVAMPEDDPGTMTPQQSVDVVAYILSVNKLPAGKNELPPDLQKLKQIKIEPTKPKLSSSLWLVEPLRGDRARPGPDHELAVVERLHAVDAGDLDVAEE